MVRSEEQDVVEILKQTVENLKREKQQIISIVSHDLKAPLTRIFALAQLLSMDADNLNPEQQQYLDKIHQVVADGLSMVRNLVDYRNLEYRGIELNPEQINVKTFVFDTVRNFQPLADKKNIRINFHAPKDVVIISDNQCLGRVVDSLLSNAIKFSADGKVVDVEVTETELYVDISVTDQARGFTEEDCEKLYQKFQKLSTKPTGGESSTGLGLFVAHQFLDKIGGTIRCKTHAGVGSTFTISLPR
jgi:signal transduction histidine kinase